MVAKQVVFRCLQTLFQILKGYFQRGLNLLPTRKRLESWVRQASCLKIFIISNQEQLGSKNEVNVPKTATIPQRWFQTTTCIAMHVMANEDMLNHRRRWTTTTAPWIWVEGGTTGAFDQPLLPRHVAARSVPVTRRRSRNVAGFWLTAVLLIVLYLSTPWMSNENSSLNDISTFLPQHALVWTTSDAQAYLQGSTPEYAVVLYYSSSNTANTTYSALLDQWDEFARVVQQHELVNVTLQVYVAHCNTKRQNRDKACHDNRLVSQPIMNWYRRGQLGHALQPLVDAHSKNLMHHFLQMWHSVLPPEPQLTTQLQHDAFLQRHDRALIMYSLLSESSSNDSQESSILCRILYHHVQSNVLALASVNCRDKDDVPTLCTDLKEQKYPYFLFLYSKGQIKGIIRGPESLSNLLFFYQQVDKHQP